MTTTIDGFNFSVPPQENEVVGLAQFHRKQLDDAIFHQEIHLGDYCLAQRKRVYDFTKTLSFLIYIVFSGILLSANVSISF